MADRYDGVLVYNVTSSGLVHTRTVRLGDYLRSPYDVAYLSSGELAILDQDIGVHVVDGAGRLITTIPKPPGVTYVLAVAVWTDGTMAVTAWIYSPQSTPVYILHPVY